MMRAAREFVTDTLRKYLPKRWRVINWQQNPDQLDRITVAVTVQRVKRADELPMGAYDTTVILTLVSPTDDWEQAETQLEEALETLTIVVEDHFGTAWDEATKRTVYDRYLAWDIPVHVITTRED